MKTDEVVDLRKRIRSEKDGLRFIKTVKVGVPYAKIVLDITVRKELNIPLSHETIMKLIREKWNNYDEIRKLLGIDTDYLDNVILELGQSDYITHEGKQLYLSNTGKNVLKELKSIKIEPEILNNLIINLVDGTLLHELDDLVLKEKINSDAVLSKTTDIDIGYLVKYEAEIRDIYKERQMKEQTTHDLLVGDELYRIVKIQKMRTFFNEVKMDIYFSMEDSSIDFVFNTGDQRYDELLSNMVRQQLKTQPKLFERMFDSEYYFRNRWNTIELNELVSETTFQLMYERREKLINLVNSYSAQTNGEEQEEIEKLYFDDRAMLYKEYQTFVLGLIRSNPRELLIVSDRFYELTGDDNIISIIDSIINKSNVYIGYMTGDFGTMRFIDKIKKRHPENKHLFLKELFNIRRTTIIAGNEFMIKIYYKPIKLGREIIFEEIPILTYDPVSVKSEFSNLQSLFF